MATKTPETKETNKGTDTEAATTSGAPGEDVEGITPDQSFLTNPTDNTEVKMKEVDDRYLDSISKDRRALVSRARGVLMDNTYHFDDSVDALSVVHKSFQYFDPRQQVKLSGKLTIKYTPRAEMIGNIHLKQYLDKLNDFSGSAGELVSHIAQDLFVAMRPQKVSVTFVTVESGLDVRAQKTHEWGVGFKS